MNSMAPQFNAIADLKNPSLLPTAILAYIQESLEAALNATEMNMFLCEDVKDARVFIMAAICKIRETTISYEL